MTTRDNVLTLLKESGAIYSGAKLATQLGVSRTAIWKAIRELEKHGYQFEHTPTGYRFLADDRLDAQAIKNETLSFLNVKTFAESESTMKDAKLAALQKENAPLLFVADTQTAAHGRFGRPFFANKGQGIYMSLLLNPKQAFQELPQYTVLAAVAVSQAIDELTGFTTQIKWVNDIYLNDKKICGILSEAMSDFESGTISHVVIGMGINVSIPQVDFPQELQAKVTSLYPTGEAEITRNQLIQKIWANFFTLINNLDDQSYLTIYRQKSYVLGKKVTFSQQNQTYQGLATNITDTGELVVETPTKTFILSSGEISLTSIEK
ncbi:MAG: biotin--[acetyl-CoA-carboxylase] ligase [Enterococcus sp.]